MVDHITDGVIVTMTYTMTIDGELIEDAPADDPIIYLHGANTILPGLEAALEGKKIGDKLNIDLEMEPEIWEAPRGDFDLPNEAKVGDQIEIEDMDGDVMVAEIAELTDEMIKLRMDDIEDWMAGKTANFNVEVLALRESTAEERLVGEPEEYFELLDDDHDHDHDHDDH
jgi:FKBP-type peptidyl-prolyl cis-trans isomerase SlyD